MKKETIKEMLQKNIDDILKLKEQGLKLTDIAKIYGVSDKSIGRALKSVGKPARNILTDDVVLEIIEEYKKGLSISKISKKYHFAEKTISETLKENNICIRNYGEHTKKYTLNEHYFDVIDTQEKAYIIGLLMADGCIYDNKISISLVENDKHILEKINILLESNRPLYFINLSNKNNNCNNQYRLTISNKYMAKKLISLGVFERKSLILEYPNWLHDDLFKHFIRGYIDGDGSVDKTRNAVSFLGTYNFCISVQNKIFELLGLKFGMREEKRACNCYEAYIKNYNGVKTFLDYIYNDATIYLNRKYEIYKERYINNSHAA